MWQPSVLETYGNQTTTYVNQTLGPLRLKYPNLMGEKELISSLTKVLQICQHHVWFSPLQGEGYYNAYEKDIAVLNLFFGQPTVYGGLNSLNSVQVDVAAQLDHWISYISICKQFNHFRIQENAKNDVVGLHFWLWWTLWTLPWDQFCFHC